jgi:hypothetical protein
MGKKFQNARKFFAPNFLGHMTLQWPCPVELDPVFCDEA